MNKREYDISALDRFLPRGAFPLVAPFFQNHTIHLKLTKERKSILGDYRSPNKLNPIHRISININLNQYSFLVTLLHELAHLLTYIEHHHQVPAHGKEWKAHFRKILIPFLEHKIFPKDIQIALINYIKNPAASTCSDENLYKALYKYEPKESTTFLVGDLNIGDTFSTKDGRTFQKMEILRKRSKCLELKTRKMYLFPAIIEVKKIDTLPA